MSFIIFISYRRSDTQHVAGRLYDRLAQAYSPERLFIDVDSIAKGDDFVTRMKEKVAEADVVLALIGETWLAAADESGQRRLDDADDPVRIELETALAAGKTVIPVLVGKAEMPRERQLPEPLKPLARRNAEKLWHESFADDVRRLCAAMERVASGTQPARKPQWTRRLAMLGVAATAVGGVELGRRFYPGWEEEPSFSPPRLLETLGEHEGSIRAVAFQPNGGWLATASSDGTARLWDAATGVPVREPMRHEGEVWSLAFSSDGRTLATASGDGAARLWDVWEGALLGAPMRHNGGVWSVAFSPDGQRLATTSLGVHLWDAATQAPLASPVRDSSIVMFATFSPDGRRLATAGADGARLWDAATGEPAGEPMLHEGILRCAAFSPDGQRLATASTEGTARLWDAATGAPLGEAMRHQDVVGSVAFSPDGRLVATASSDRTARLWDAATGAPLGAPLENERALFAVAFSPNGARLATGGYRTAQIWAF